MITFRIFISSTFADFEQERAVLQDVIDKLRPWCAVREARLEVVDLRWGVNEREQLVHGTLDLCLDEIRRCHNAKPRPNFIIFAGSRYGWRPLPSRVNGAVWARLTEVGEAERSLLTTWFEPDPSLLDPATLEQPALPVWALQPVDETLPGRGAAAWSAAEITLRAVFDRAAEGLCEDELVGIAGSATHQEVVLGALQAGCERPLLFLRSIEGPVRHPTPFADPPEAAVVQRDGLLSSLWKRFGDQPDTLALAVAQAELGQPGAEYLTAFGNWAEFRLRDHVERQLQAAHAAATPAKVETEAHAAYGAVRLTGQTGRRSFIGRVAELGVIHDHLRQVSRPLLLMAPGGSGKTALIAEAVRLARLDGLRIIERYAGATPASLSNDLPLTLGMLAAEGCDALLIDGMDLLPAGLPNQLVTLAAGLGLPLCATIRVEEGQKPPVWAAAWDTRELAPVREGAPPADVLDATMAAATLPRRLVGERRDHVLGLLGPDAPPLAVRIAAGLAGRAGAVLPAAPTDLAGWVEAALDDAESASMPVLARSAVEAIALSRFGMSREELADLLWEDGDVRSEFAATRHWDWPDAGLPPILLSRVLDRLQPVLIEAETDGATTFRFLHREFQDAATRRAAGPEQRRAALGRFFSRGLPRTMGATVTPQMRRALLEAPRAIIGSGDVAAMMLELADLRFIGVKAWAGLLPDLFEDFREMHRHTSAAAPLISWLGTIASEVQRTPWRGGLDRLVQSASEMPPDHPAHLLARRWLREDGANHRWLQGPVATGRPTFSELGLAFDAVAVTGGRLVTWSEPDPSVQQVDVWDLETTMRLGRFLHADATPDRMVEVGPADRSQFWTWFAAAEPEPPVVPPPVARPQAGQRSLFGSRPQPGPRLDLRDMVACGVWLWREDPADPAVDALSLPALCWCRPLDDGRLLLCDWTGEIRVLRAGLGIEVDWQGATPNEPGRHAWRAAGLGFELLRTEGFGAVLTVVSPGSTVTATVPEPGTWQLETLLSVGGMILVHPGAVCTGLHPVLQQLVFEAPVAARRGRFGTTLARFGDDGAGGPEPLKVDGRPLGALATEDGALVWTVDRSHPADPEPSCSFRVYRVEGRHGMPELLHRFDNEVSGLAPVAGLGLWISDPKRGLMLVPLDRTRPVRYIGSRTSGLAALPGGGVAAWIPWGPDDNEPVYGDKRLNIWSSDGTLIGSYGPGGIVREVAGTSDGIVALLEGGSAVRIDRQAAGAEQRLVSTAARWRRDTLLAAELGGGLVSIEASSGRRRPLPDTGRGDDVIHITPMPGDWMAVRRGDGRSGLDLRTEIYDEAEGRRLVANGDCSVSRLASGRLLIEDDVWTPSATTNALTIPRGAEMLASGIVWMPNEDGSAAAFDGYAGLPITVAGLGAVSDILWTQADVGRGAGTEGIGRGFAVEFTSEQLTLSDGVGMPLVTWAAAPAEVVYAEARADGALVLLDSGEPRHLVLCRGDGADREAIRAAAQRRAAMSPVQTLPTDAELFARAEMLHDHTLATAKTNWETGRGHPTSVFEAALNRWRLSCFRDGRSTALAARLIESLPPEWAEHVKLEQAFDLLELASAVTQPMAGNIVAGLADVCARQDLGCVGLASTVAAVRALLSQPGVLDDRMAALAASIQAASATQVQIQRRRRGIMGTEFVELTEAVEEEISRSKAAEDEASWLRDRRGPLG